MTVSIQTELIDVNTIRANWSSTLSPPVSYWIYVNGVQKAAAVSYETMDFQVPTGTKVYLEIFDTISHTAAPVQFDSIFLRWYHTVDADAYRIEEYVGAAWVIRGYVSDGGEWFFDWGSRELEDETTHRFRVVPRLKGEDGTGQEFYFFMVRQPDPPAVDYAYAPGTAKVTVSAA